MSTEPKMDPQLRARLVEQLHHRAQRLADCTQITHPAHLINAIIALMAGHVARTAMVLLGDDFSRDLLEHLFDGLAEDHGICRFCRARPLRDDKTMCQFCWDQASSDDEITDDELADVALEAIMEKPDAAPLADPR